MKYESIKSINTESLRIIAAIFSEIPDESLKLKCTNDSQSNYFNFLKHFFTQISKAISNYFLGKPLFEGVDTTDKARLEIEIEKWLCFYCLLQWGWDYILLDAPSKGWEILCTPGQALQMLLINHAESMFATHQAKYLEFSPRRGYKQLSLMPQMEGILSKLENGGELTIKDIKVINEFNKNRQKGEQVKAELSHFFEFCEQVFSKYRNKPQIKHKYKDYLRIRSESEALEQRMYHPSQKAKGFKVIKGICSNLA
jgi:cellulose biosynthesis protein BcsQ